MSTEAPGFEGYEDGPVLARLTGLTNVAHVFGKQADAENTSAERVVWIPGPWSDAPLKFGASDGDAFVEDQRTYTVQIYGAGIADIKKTFDDLRRALFDEYSPSAYEIVKKTAEPKNNSVSGQGWSVSPTIILKGPLYRAKWIDGVSRTVTSGLVVTKPDGTGAEEVPS